MLSPGYLKLGEVLYLSVSQGVPKYGYVLTRGSSETKEYAGRSAVKAEDATAGDVSVGDQAAASGAGPSNVGDCIDLLDDDSSEDDETDVAPSPARDTAPTGAVRGEASIGAARGAASTGTASGAAPTGAAHSTAPTGAARGAAPTGAARGATPMKATGAGPRIEVSGAPMGTTRTPAGDSQPPVTDATKQANDAGKGTAEDPCELLSSDDEELEVRHVSGFRCGVGGRVRGGRGGSGRAGESTGRGAAGAQGGRGRGRPRKQPQQSERDAQRSSAAQQQQPRQRGEMFEQARQPQQTQPHPRGAGPSGAGASGAGPGQQRPIATFAPSPPPPSPSHPDDTPAVLASRKNLSATFRDIRMADKACNELLEVLHAKQAEYHRTVMQAPSGAAGEGGVFAQQQHGNRLNHATAVVHQVLNRLNVARNAAGLAAAQHKRAVEELDAAVGVMERDRRSAAQHRQGEEIASEFQKEIQAWELVEQTNDLNIFPAGELKRIAALMGVDITGCVEKAELTTAINAKREGGREAWVSRKRKRAVEEEIAARQRRKLAELRETETRREADESAQSIAKQRAVAQVAVWARNADLRLFLQRCGIAVDAGVGKTKKLLTASYRRAMMRYHPDRTRRASVEEQALAAEVTKWITHAWQSLAE